MKLYLLLVSVLAALSMSLHQSVHAGSKTQASAQVAHVAYGVGIPGHLAPNDCQQRTILPLIQKAVERLFPDKKCSAFLQRVYVGKNNRKYYQVEFQVAGRAAFFHTLTVYYDADAVNPHATIFRYIDTESRLDFNLEMRVDRHSGQQYYSARYSSSDDSRLIVRCDTLETNTWTPDCDDAREPWANRQTGKYMGPPPLQFYPDDCHLEAILPRVTMHMAGLYPGRNPYPIEQRIYEAGDAGKRFYYIVYRLDGTADPVYTVASFLEAHEGWPDVQAVPAELEASLYIAPCMPGFEYAWTENYDGYYECRFLCDTGTLVELGGLQWPADCR